MYTVTRYQYVPENSYMIRIDQLYHPPYEEYIIAEREKRPTFYVWGPHTVRRIFVNDLKYFKAPDFWNIL